MATLTRLPLFIRFDAPEKATELTAGTPKVPRGCDVTINLGVFFKGNPLDLTNVSSLHFEIAAGDKPTSARLVSKVIPAADFTTAVLDKTAFLAGTAAHVVLNLTGDEMNPDLGNSTSKSYVVILSGITTAGTRVAYGKGAFTVFEDGTSDNAAPPPEVSSPTYLTAAQVQALIASLSGSGGGSGLDFEQATFDNDVYTVAPLIPPAALVDGLFYSFLAPSANTGAATLTISGLQGATVDIVKITAAGIVDLVAGDIRANQPVFGVILDASFVVLSQLAVTPSGGTGNGNIRETVTDATLAAGVAAGTAVYRDAAGVWQKSRSNAQATALAHAVVEGVSGNDVDLVFAGRITLSGLTTGSTYFVSDASAGLLTATPPTAESAYKVPVLVALSATEALVVPILDLVSLAKIPAADISPSTPNAQTGTSYTLDLADAPAGVSLTNAAAIALTVPTNTAAAFPVGSEIPLLQLGAGQVTVAGDTGVTVHSRGGALKLAGQYAAACLKKLAADTWILTGDLTT